MTVDGIAVTVLVSTPFKSKVTSTITVDVGASDSTYENKYKLELEVAYFEISPYTKIGSSVNFIDLQQVVLVSFLVANTAAIEVPEPSAVST